MRCCCRAGLGKASCCLLSEPRPSVAELANEMALGRTQDRITEIHRSRVPLIKIARYQEGFEVRIFESPSKASHTLADSGLSLRGLVRAAKHQSERADRLARLRNEDAAENEQFSIPDHEIVGLHAMTLAEAFPPSKALDLSDALDKLGLSIDEVERHAARSGDGRARPVDLALICPPGDGRTSWWSHGPGERRVVTLNLPEHVECAIVTLNETAPRVPLVIVHFVLSDAVTTRLRTAANAQQMTEERTWPGATTEYYVSPSWQRYEDVEEIRTSLRTSLDTWMCRHFPGLFASVDNRPTLDLLTTDYAGPLGILLPKHEGNDPTPREGHAENSARSTRPLPSTTAPIQRSSNNPKPSERTALPTHDARDARRSYHQSEALPVRAVISALVPSVLPAIQPASSYLATFDLAGDRNAWCSLANHLTIAGPGPSSALSPASLYLTGVTNVIAAANPEVRNRLTLVEWARDAAEDYFSIWVLHWVLLTERASLDDLARQARRIGVPGHRDKNAQGVAASLVGACADCDAIAREFETLGPHSRRWRFISADPARTPRHPSRESRSRRSTVRGGNGTRPRLAAPRRRSSQANYPARVARGGRLEPDNADARQSDGLRRAGRWSNRGCRRPHHAGPDHLMSVSRVLDVDIPAQDIRRMRSATMHP